MSKEAPWSRLGRGAPEMWQTGWGHAAQQLPRRHPPCSPTRRWAQPPVGPPGRPLTHWSGTLSGQKAEETHGSLVRFCTRQGDGSAARRSVFPAHWRPLLHGRALGRPRVPEGPWARPCRVLPTALLWSLWRPYMDLSGQPPWGLLDAPRAAQARGPRCAVQKQSRRRWAALPPPPRPVLSTGEAGAWHRSAGRVAAWPPLSLSGTSPAACQSHVPL